MDRLDFWGCEGKTSFPTKAAALERLKRQAKRFGGVKRRESASGIKPRLEPYRCSVCHKFHIGNSASKPRRGDRGKHV